MALPEYDPACGINRFQWIVEQAKIVRAERQASMGLRQLLSKADRELLRDHDASIDAEDEMRLRNLRRQYDPARNRATR